MSDRVWDLPLRVFHWALALLVAASIYTGLAGGVELPEWGLLAGLEWLPFGMEWHVYSGYGVLTLLVFRVAWGFAGTRWSRFASFVRPLAVWGYVRGLLRGGQADSAGHSPLAGLSVVAMLLALGVQAASGLFANDDIFTEGPLAHWVSEAASDWLTSLHEANALLLYALIALHLLAIAGYEFIKGERLALPMLTGRKAGVAGYEARPLREALTALALLALAAGGVYLLVG